MYLFLTNQSESGGLSLPAMTIIAMLLLMLPYLLRRYTGRSITDWLRLGVIAEGIENLADKIRRALFGNSGGLLGKKLGIDPAKTAEGAKGKNGRQAQREAASRQAAAQREAEKERTRSKQRAGNVKNDYLQAISRILTFTRKNRLFAILPGNIQHEGAVADLTAIVVTHRRVVGIMAHGFDGKILCRRDDRSWQVTDSNGTRQIGNLTREAKVQDELVKAALAAHGMADIPYETAILFTSSGAQLAGERPALVYTCDELFAALGSDADLHGSALDPKETGRRIGALREGKKK